MRRTIIVAATAVLVLASPAWAADEDEAPPPSTGGPLLTIPIDVDDIDDLVVSDVEVEPITDLVPGQSVRVSARLGVAMAPERTVLLLDGDMEIEGDVVVSDDGFIDHMFVIPPFAEPGTHVLTLAATGLGIAELGTIEIVANAQPPASTTTEASSPTATTTAPAAAAGDDEDSAVDAGAPTGGVIAGESRVGLSLAVGAGLLLSIVIAVLIIDRRRRTAVASFAESATLPTARTQLPRAPQSPVASAESSAAVRGPVAEETPAAQQPATPPPDAATAVFQLVELHAAPDADEDQPAEETALGQFSELDAAKVEARRRHAADAAGADAEHWWEIRTKSLGTVWMLHAWARREYDLHGRQDAAMEPEQGVS